MIRLSLPNDFVADTTTKLGRPVAKLVALAGGAPEPTGAVDEARDLVAV